MKTSKMFIKQTCLVMLLSVFVSCNGNKKGATDVVNSNVQKTEQQTPDAAHSSNNALDWPGTYIGVVPCADCNGIKTTITLKEDQTFVKTTVYLGKDSKEFSETGKFIWYKDGSSVILQTEQKAHYQVGEDALWQLDNKGNIIKGNLAEKYKLAKQ